MKKLLSLLLSLGLLLTLCVTASAELTLEELTAMLAVTPDTEGKTADELYALGRQYETGDGVTQWYAMAKACYEAAEAAGSADATAALAALQQMKENVLANSPDGQGEVFDFYRTGVTASQAGDYDKTYAVYYDDAFFFCDPLLRGIGGLGDLLRDGTGVEQDVSKAIAIYEFNARVLGKGNGYTSLGLLYNAPDGTYEGVAHSEEQALNCFLLSWQGEGLSETDFKGPRYAGVLYDSGYTLDDGTAVAPDCVKAEEAFLIAAAGNGRTFDGTACVYLGQYYEEGREGVAADMEKAVTYYAMALSDRNVHGTMLGIPQAALVLGRCYENGQGVEADAAAAIQYYTLARDFAQENLDLVNAAGNNEAMIALRQEAADALARLGAE
ncbi:MAG: tetratricopeptide repeat protein [Aristaeellaceae bacterium]